MIHDEIAKVALSPYLCPFGHTSRSRTAGRLVHLYLIFRDSDVLLSACPLPFLSPPTLSVSAGDRTQGFALVKNTLHP